MLKTMGRYFCPKTFNLQINELCYIKPQSPPTVSKGGKVKKKKN